VQCGFCISALSGAYCGFSCPDGGSDGAAGSDVTAIPDGKADADAARDVADAGCVTGCTRMGASGWCASLSQIEWVCGGQHDRARLMAAGCTELPTGAIRYCCPDVLSACP
jgi:hypothetical protein